MVRATNIICLQLKLLLYYNFPITHLGMPSMGQVKMSTTPQRLLLAGFFICLLLGLAIDKINSELPVLDVFPDENLQNSGNLLVARYYWHIGEFEKAIKEYQRVIPTQSESDRDLTLDELEKLIFLEQSTSGRLTGNLVYYTWLLPQKLYITAGVFYLIAAALFVHQRTTKTPKFVIQSFYDRTGLGIGNNLSQIALDRIHEIEWRARNLESSSELIGDNIEIPALSLMSEGDNQGAIELLDMALLFSIGSTGLPFSHVIDAFKLWLEQPPFLVRGTIDKQENTIILKMLLFNRKKKAIEQAWHSEITYKDDVPIPKVIDTVIYPLLFYFNNINASRWEALQALHLGLEEFQLFRENPANIKHLESARQELERAIFLDPGYELAKYNLSLLLLAVGEFERSREYLRELSTLSPNPQLRLKAKYNYGIVLFHISQDWAYKQAVKVFEELLDQEEHGQ